MNEHSLSWDYDASSDHVETPTTFWGVIAAQDIAWIANAQLASALARANAGLSVDDVKLAVTIANEND